MFNLILKLVIIYLIYRLFSVLIQRSVMYYRAYRTLKRKQQEQAVQRKSNFNLNAYDVEDAEFEEIKPGQED